MEHYINKVNVYRLKSSLATKNKDHKSNSKIKRCHIILFSPLTFSHTFYSAATISRLWLQSSAMGPTDDAKPDKTSEINKTGWNPRHLRAAELSEPHADTCESFKLWIKINKTHQTVKGLKSLLSVLPGRRIFLLLVQSAARDSSLRADWTEHNKRMRVCARALSKRVPCCVQAHFVKQTVQANQNCNRAVCFLIHLISDAKQQ